jgi:ribosome maturation protein Sdo1
LCLNLIKNQMKNITSLFFLFLIFSSIQLFSQQRNNAIDQKEIAIIHYYTFEANNVSQDRLDALQQALVKLEFVTETKIKYKAEKGKGQVIMVIKQPPVTSESQKEFSPTIIKKTLLNMGFTPVQHSTGAYTIK